MADEAVMDTGTAEVSTVEETTVDTGAEPIETEVVTETAPEGETDPGTPAGEPPTAKALYERAKALDPELAKGIRQHLFQAEAFNKAMPGGLREYQALKQTLEKAGGEAGIAEKVQELDGWHQFDTQFMAGDPKAIDFMLETPEGQDAFMKLLPNALGKYAEMDQEGYTAYVMREVANDAYAEGIPLNLMRLADLIGDNPKAMELFGKIKGYFERMEAWAKKPTNTKSGAAKPKDDPAAVSQIEQRQKDLEAREEQLTMKDLGNRVYSEVKPTYDSEMARLISKRVLSQPQKDRIAKNFQIDYGEARASIQEKAKQYLKAKDHEGFVKYHVTESKKLIPVVMRKVFDEMFPGAKPAGKPTAAGVPGKPNAAPLRVDPGWIQVAKQPNSSEIDWSNDFNIASNMYPEDRSKPGRVILKDGRKIMYKR